MNENRRIGPNLKLLMIRKMAREAIPNGTGEPMVYAMAALGDKDRTIQLFKDALAWCDQAILAVRAAPDNPYGNDEEVIAGAILKQLDGAINRD